MARRTWSADSRGLDIDQLTQRFDDQQAPWTVCAHRGTSRRCCKRRWRRRRWVPTNPLCVESWTFLEEHTHGERRAPRDQQALLQADMVAAEMAGASRLAMDSATSSVSAALR